MTDKKILKKLLKPFSRKLEEFKTNRSRKNPPPHTGKPEHGLKEYQVYPFGDNFFPCMVPVVEREFSGLNFDGQTPVASIGSCFAEEFAYHMLEKKLNYLKTEKTRCGASANWGRVYTIPNLNQIIDYSMSPEFPMVIERTGARSAKQKDENGWFDPLRDRAPMFAEKEAAATEIAAHRLASLEVFKKARILVITLGQNEGWRDTTNNLIWAQRPPSDIFDANPQRFTYETFQHADIQRLMIDSLEKLFRLNPGLSIIMSVSPVPAFATFHDKSVVPDSFYNKCLLRVIVEDMVNRFKGKIHYFPSFEMALAYNPFSYKPDNRHILPRALKHIFHTLDKGLKIKE